MLFVFVGFMNLPFPITPIQINWVTFGTVNVFATLVAVKILRPAYMPRFRDDVLDYVVTGSFLGSAMMALLYAVVYFATGLDAATARSALSIFATLFGILIFWNTFGIDLAEPRSLIENRVATILGSVFGIAVLLGFYLMPELFEFVAPSTGITIFTVTLFLLTVVLLSWSMKYRQLINRLWLLFSP
jgi:hypothetical protein